jgi:hypothetical protein
MTSADPESGARCALRARVSMHLRQAGDRIYADHPRIPAVAAISLRFLNKPNNCAAPVGWSPQIEMLLQKFSEAGRIIPSYRTQIPKFHRAVRKIPVNDGLLQNFHHAGVPAVSFDHRQKK